MCYILYFQVCEAIQAEYKQDQLPIPMTEEAWAEIAEGFRTKWNFPHCCGALNGKHITIRKPPNSGSTYYNYKDFFSVILLALVDANYKFIWVDIGG